MAMLLKIGIRAAAAGVLCYAFYWAVVRPWHVRWGATKLEYAQSWPGDEILAAASPTPITRAITINAPAAAVWPWIAQIGQDRGGFYSYTWLENMVGASMRNADSIHPEWQSRTQWENLYLAKKERFNGEGRLVVARFEPGRTMVLVTPNDAEALRHGGRAQEFVWSFTLEPIDERTTRLICHSNGGGRGGWTSKVAERLFWEPAHFVMERGMMVGIKERAER
jgi:hypothetical protein